MRGYDPDEVDTFLAMVADEMEELIGVGQEVKAEAASLKKRLAEYQLMENTMRETMSTVQKAADEKRKAVHKEADMVLKEAEIQASKWIEDAYRSIRDIKRELAKLRGMRDSFVTRLRMLVQAQLDMLKMAEMEEETPDETLDLFEEKLKELTEKARERVTRAGVMASNAPDPVFKEEGPAEEEDEAAVKESVVVEEEEGLVLMSEEEGAVEEAMEEETEEKEVEEKEEY